MSDDEKVCAAATILFLWQAVAWLGIAMVWEPWALAPGILCLIGSAVFMYAGAQADADSRR